MITRAEIEDYQRIYKSIYHTDITHEEAMEQWIKLVVLLEAILK